MEIIKVERITQCNEFCPVLRRLHRRNRELFNAAETGFMELGKIWEELPDDDPRKIRLGRLIVRLYDVLKKSA